MDQTEFDALDTRIRARADRLWQDAGSPEGGSDAFMENARQLVALEEVPAPTLDANAGSIVEEASLQRNLGEFPTLRDQGDEQTYPDDDPGSIETSFSGLDDGEIRLSDGDASETGGVLPIDEVAGDNLFDVSVADADVTSDMPEDDADIELDDDLDEDHDDLNDDGLPDEPPFRR